MEKRINFKTKNYFEGVFYAIGWISGFIAVGLLFTNWYLTPIFGFIAFFIITAQYKLAINLESEEIDDFLFILGMKTQHEKLKFSSLEYVYITQSKYTQQMNYKSISSTIAGDIYSAYLKTDVANIFLKEDKNLAELKRKVRPLADQLKLEVKSLTGP